MLPLIKHVMKSGNLTSQFAICDLGPFLREVK